MSTDFNEFFAANGDDGTQTERTYTEKQVQEELLGGVPIKEAQKVLKKLFPENFI